MIKKFKIFENVENYEKFELKKYSCWIIYGDMPDILKIIEKIDFLSDKEDFERDFNKAEDLKRELKFQLLRDDKKYFSISIILYFGKGFSYSLIRNTEDKERLLNAIMRSDTYKFEGEIKLIDDKLFLDKIEIDAMKYNL